MTPSGLELVGRIAHSASAALAAAGLFLIFLDIGQGHEPSGLRRRLTALWRRLGGASAAEVPRLAIAATVQAIDRFVNYWFEQSERNVATAGAFTLMVFIAIPAAALLNWIRGGSPLLLLLLLACAAGVALFAVLSETRRQPSLTRLLSVTLFTAIFLVVPGYVFVSLTGRILWMPIGHGMLAAILISPLLYLICHSAILLGAGAYAAPVASIHATTGRRIATLFLGFVPFAFIAAFAAFLVWHLADAEAPVPATWRTLILLMVCGASTAAISVHLAASPARRQSRSGILARLAAATGIAILFGAVMAYVSGGTVPASLAFAIPPLLMPAVLVAMAGLALLAKLVLTLAQLAARGDSVAERPYRIVGVLALILAAGVGWASAAL